MTARNRICHLVHQLALGGLQTQLLRIVEATPDDEAAYTVGYIGGETAMRSDFEAAGARVVDLQTGSDSPVAQFSPLVLRRIAGFLREEGFDVLHVHGSLYLFLVARVCGRLAGVPVVGTFHNVSDSYHPGTRVMERVTRPLSAVDIAVSEDVERSFAGSARRYELGQDGLDRPTYTVHNGIDVEAFRARVAEADAEPLYAEYDVGDGPVFLNVGRYTEVKNQRNLVRAMAELVDDWPDAHLFVVGWGPLGDELRDTAARHGIADNVSVTGRVDSVADYYSTADAFVLPSTTEGLSVVLLEAMAAGLPVVGTPAPGTEEAVVDGETGVITASTDPADLAEGLRRMTDDSRRERMGKNGYERSRSEFTIQKTARSYMRVYDAVQ